MKSLLITTATLALLATPAFARGDNWITLYSAPFFQGQSVTIDHPVRNLDRYGFNDRAQSVRVGGTWTLCAANDFEGDCVTIDHDIRDLKRRDMNRRANSVRPAGGRRGHADRSEY